MCVCACVCACVYVRVRVHVCVNVCLCLTRAMDTTEDWAERKEQEKIDRYSSLLGFINHLSYREKSGWKASENTFTTGVRGSLHTNQFLTRLESLGVKNINTREAIRNRTVQKTFLCRTWSSSFSLLHWTPRQIGPKIYLLKSSTRTWRDLIYIFNHQGRDHIA